MGVYEGHLRMCDKYQLIQTCIKHVNVGSLTPLRSMELSIKVETVKTGRSILYIEGFNKNIIDLV